MDVIIHFLLAKKIPSWVQAVSRLRDHVHQESYEETSSFISCLQAETLALDSKTIMLKKSFLGASRIPTTRPRTP